METARPGVIWRAGAVCTARAYCRVVVRALEVHGETEHAPPRSGAGRARPAAAPAPRPSPLSEKSVLTTKVCTRVIRALSVH